ncbi:unnamed protein product [Closterium sp. NIES-64]|nr:unnamed protein product [Closterium sp. NIES-64]
MEYPPRKIAIAIDLSDESAHAVIILHVRPTSLLYGADWGAWEATDAAKAADREIKERAEEEFDALTLAKARELAEPLKLAGIPFRVHIVKDHDMKERICLEVERLGVSACIMGSRGFGAHGRARKSRLGSVSDYCVHHSQSMADHPDAIERPDDPGDEHARRSPIDLSAAVTGLDLLFSNLAAVDNHGKAPAVAPTVDVPFEPIDEPLCPSPTAPVLEQDSSNPSGEEIAAVPVAKKAARYTQSTLPWPKTGGPAGAIPASPADQLSTPATAGTQASPSTPGPSKPLDIASVHGQIRRSISFLESRYVDCGDDFGGRVSARLSPFIKKHGPDGGNPEVKVQGADSDGRPTTHTFELHEKPSEDYPTLGSHDACVDLCTTFAETLVQNLSTRFQDLDSLVGVRLFMPDEWELGRAERHKQCLEWLESLVRLFRAQDTDYIIPASMVFHNYCRVYHTDTDVMVEALLDSIKWDDKGLVVAIAQHADTGAILMQGFANRDAVSATLASDRATFFSRSRKCLWTKGETSGHFINVLDMFIDCDRDTIIYLGIPDGPTCHTGTNTCFFTKLDLSSDLVAKNKSASSEDVSCAQSTLFQLEEVIASRRRQMEQEQQQQEQQKPGEERAKPSWTARLLSNHSLLCSKIREEADELCQTLEGNEAGERAASEMADVLYHSMVLLAVKGVKMEDVASQLRRRFSMSGIDEKESRKSKSNH